MGLSSEEDGEKAEEWDQLFRPDTDILSVVRSWVRSYPSLALNSDGPILLGVKLAQVLTGRLCSVQHSPSLWAHFSSLSPHSLSLIHSLMLTSLPFLCVATHCSVAWLPLPLKPLRPPPHLLQICAPLSPPWWVLPELPANNSTTSNTALPLLCFIFLLRMIAF